MGSLAGGEQSATQPPALLQLAKSPPVPDEELELELELVVVPELDDPVVVPELDELDDPVVDPVLDEPVNDPELLAAPPAPPVPEVVEAPPAPPPPPEQAARRGTRAARQAWRRFMVGPSSKSRARGDGVLPPGDGEGAAIGGIVPR